MNPSRVFISFVIIVICAGVMSSCGPSDNGTALSPTATGLPISTATAAPPLAPTSTAPGGTEAPGGIPVIGNSAPDFTLPSVWGDDFALSNYRADQNVVLLFYRTGS